MRIFDKIFNLFVGISIILSIFSVYLLFTKKINLGVDFSGGIVAEISIEKDYLKSSGIDSKTLRNTMAENGFENFSIQSVGENQFSIKFQNFHNKNVKIQDSDESSKTQELNITQESSNSQEDQLRDSVKKFNLMMANMFGDNASIDQIEYVGPQITGSLVKNGIIIVILSVIIVMSYIFMRFNWQFAIGILLASVHDILMILGMFSLTQLELNISSIAAILTVIGYSINDSVVIYDRVRENIKLTNFSNARDLVYKSIISTIGRTTITSGTTLVTVICLTVIIGRVLYSFSIPTMCGIVVGTYSSIFISTLTIFLLDIKKLKL